MKRIIAIAAALFICSISFAGTNINADEAGNYIGQTVTISSKVYGVMSSPQGTQLYVGASYPKNPLTITLLKDGLNFKYSSEKYKDKVITVTGMVKGSKNKPEIVLSKESDLVIKSSTGDSDLGLPDPGNRYFY